MNHCTRAAILLLLAGCAVRPGGTSGPVAVAGLGNSASLVRMGDQMRDAGDVFSAAEFYQGATQRDGSDPVPHVRLGDLYRALGDAGPAQVSYRAALAADPRNAPAQAGLGAALLAEGKAAEALALLEPASRGSADPKLLRNYGVALDMTGKQGEAQAAYRRGLAVARTDQDLRSNLALSLAISGQTEEAISTLRAGDMRQQAGNLVLLLTMARRETEARAEGATLLPEELANLLARGRLAAAAAAPAERAVALGVSAPEPPPPVQAALQPEPAAGSSTGPAEASRPAPRRPAPGPGPRPMADRPVPPAPRS